MELMHYRGAVRNYGGEGKVDESLVKKITARIFQLAFPTMISEDEWGNPIAPGQPDHVQTTNVNQAQWKPIESKSKQS